MGVSGQLRELHLFAGAGGGILGSILLGHRCVCAVEIEPYRRKVLLQRQRDGILPRFPIWDDVRTFRGEEWRGRIDALHAGIPCQRVSVAGSGEGFIDQDYYEAFLRIVRDSQPGQILLENSSMLVSRGLGSVLWDLAELGYDAGWGVFSSADMGAWHDRKRIFIHAFNSVQNGKQGLRELRSSGIVRPWREIGEERLRSILERPTTDQGQIKPLLSGVEYGMADWVDRVECIGDGQVPAVVKLAWETLSP